MALKYCRDCQTDKDKSEFYHKQAICKACTGVRNKLYRESNSVKMREYDRARYESEWARQAWHSARRRAAAAELPFNIAPEDIVVPELCPVLGIPIFLTRGKAGPNAPSLDRIIPEDGYVRGNVIVVSWRANRLRSDGTSAELSAVAAYYAKLGRG